MEEIAISVFKAKCTELIARVEKTRKPIRITRHGKPVAEIVPPTKVLDRAEWIGSLQGHMKITGDIISPATDPDDWEVLRD